MTDEEIRRVLRKKRKQQLARRRITSLIVAITIAVGGGYLAGRLIGNKTYSDEMKKVVSVAEDKPIINAAMGQIGNKGGKPFWSWFGFKSREEWCACFVSWCEDSQNYISEGIAPNFAMVRDGANWFKDRDQWMDPSSTPVANDLIFFDWDGDEVLDHVGIVTAENVNPICSTVIPRNAQYSDKLETVVDFPMPPFP